MKISHLIITMNLMLLPTLTCRRVHNSFHRKRSENSETFTHLGPSAEDKEILNEALQLLNVGKRILGLSTENPEFLVQLVDSTSEQASQIQQLLQEPSKNATMPNGEQYLVLSGSDGHIQVDNYTNSTTLSKVPSPVANDSEVEDVFKMVMEKKYPEKAGKGRVLHKITIIESSQLKPFDEKEFPHHISAVAAGRGKRHMVRSLRKVFNLPRSRKKRTKDKSARRYLFRKYAVDEAGDDAEIPEEVEKFEDPHNLEDPVDNYRFLTPHYSPQFRFPRPKVRNGKRNTVGAALILPHEREFLEDFAHDKEDTHYHFSSYVEEATPSVGEFHSSSGAQERLLEKSLLAYILQLKTNQVDKDEKQGTLFESATAFFVFFICLLLIFLIYRWWLSKKNGETKTLELNGANVIVKWRESLGKHFNLPGRANRKFFNNPFGKMDYHMVPTEDPAAELEWQSEIGEWLSDRDPDERGVI